MAWSATILPQIDEPGLAQDIDMSSAYDSARNRAAAGTVVTVYLCPSTVRTAPGRDGSLVARPDGPGPTNPPYLAAAIDYGGNYGAGQVSPSANGVLLYDRAVRIAEVTDGASRTIAVLEDSGRGWPMNGEWINGENIFDVGNPINSQQDNEVWSDHPGGAMTLWCDGHAALLSDTIDVNVLRTACTARARN